MHFRHVYIRSVQPNLDKQRVVSTYSGGKLGTRKRNISNAHAANAQFPNTILEQTGE
jgi:hypothetical protein